MFLSQRLLIISFPSGKDLEAVVACIGMPSSKKTIPFSRSHLLKLIEEREYDHVRAMMSERDSRQIASLLEGVPNAVREVFMLLTPEVQAEVILWLPKSSRRRILPFLSNSEIAEFLKFTDEDDAVDMLAFVTHDQKEHIVEELRNEKREKIRKLLPFANDSAGGLMDLNFAIVQPTMTVKQIVEKIQKHVDLQQTIPVVIVTEAADPTFYYIPHKKFLLATPKDKASDLMTKLPTVVHTAKQRTLIRELRRTKHDFIGIIDKANVLLGVLQVRDLLEIANEEADRGVYGFAGVQSEESMHDDPETKVKRRYRWLIINLGTAFLAAWVVSWFESTIAQVAVLAAYMPIVAGEGGNAATQALAVVVRGLARNSISFKETVGIIWKESQAGLMNGLIMGAITALIATLMGASYKLGLILMTAMIINLFVAGFFGAMVPFVLKSLRIDPATASSIFVTTATDVIGFFVFLGLASIFLV